MAVFLQKMTLTYYRTGAMAAKPEDPSTLIRNHATGRDPEPVTVTSHPKIHLNFILPSPSRNSKSFSSRFLQQNSVSIPFSHTIATYVQHISASYILLA
jgi:hypothetical protein